MARRPVRRRRAGSVQRTEKPSVKKTVSGHVSREFDVKKHLEKTDDGSFVSGNNVDFISTESDGDFISDGEIKKASEIKQQLDEIVGPDAENVSESISKTLGKMYEEVSKL